VIGIVYEPAIPRITVNGHAGQAEKGMDIVCAAASMLTATLKAAVGAGVLAPGRAYIRGSREDGPVFAALAIGFRLLAEQYPDCVCFEERIATPQSVVCGKRIASPTE